MNAELDHDYLIPVISNSDKALVRTGKWPFASVQSFPQLTKDTLLSGM